MTMIGQFSKPKICQKFEPNCSNLIKKRHEHTCTFGTWKWFCFYEWSHRLKCYREECIAGQRLSTQNMFALVSSLLKMKTAEMVILCMARKIVGSEAIHFPPTDHEPYVKWKLPIAVDVLWMCFSVFVLTMLQLASFSGYFKFFAQCMLAMIICSLYRE